MADYDFQKGSLKLKGVADKSIKKKKKKSKKDSEKTSTQLSKSLETEETKTHSDGAGAGSSSGNQSSTSGRVKTAAELKFEEIQKKRQMARIEKAAQESHKDRVAKYNEYLASLSEHHDIPKVGPG